MRHRRRDWTTAVVSWQVKTSSVWFYLSNGCRTRNPAALTAGFHLFPAFETRYFGSAKLRDDRTDDCAFGAMMSFVPPAHLQKTTFSDDCRQTPASSRRSSLRVARITT